jgi:signal recognition particle subunit SRP54
MMKQARDIRDATSPDEMLFVIDSMLGQDAVNVANAFKDGVGVTGVVLTKLDGDARGGAALSVATITGAPILFSSTGEGLEAFEPFYPEPHGEPHSGHGRHPHSYRAGSACL